MEFVVADGVGRCPGCAVVVALSGLGLRNPVFLIQLKPSVRRLVGISDEVSAKSGKVLNVIFLGGGGLLLFVKGAMQLIASQ